MPRLIPIYSDKIRRFLSTYGEMKSVTIQILFVVPLGKHSFVIEFFAFCIFFFQKITKEFCVKRMSLLADSVNNGHFQIVFMMDRNQNQD